eukprot:5071237-Pyramimonas_sp.AAC.1
MEVGKFRKDCFYKINGLAMVAYAAGQAGTNHDEVRSEIAMYMHAASMLKPLHIQAQNASKRKASIEDRLETNDRKIEELSKTQCDLEEELITINEHIDFIERAIQEEKANRDVNMNVGRGEEPAQQQQQQQKEPPVQPSCPTPSPFAAVTASTGPFGSCSSCPFYGQRVPPPPAPVSQPPPQSSVM